jgi:hypothetical protein
MCATHNVQKMAITSKKNDPFGFFFYILDRLDLIITLHISDCFS